MDKTVEEKLLKLPVIGWLTRKAKKVILPGLEGLSLYDLLEIYSVGIVKGTFSTRAGSIAFSFFMALFPFLLFLLNLISFASRFIDDFTLQMLAFMDSLLPPKTQDLFNETFMHIANEPRAGLLSFVFFLSIFLMANGVNAIFTGFEYSYHTNKNRSIIRQYFVAVGVAILIAFMLLVTVISTIYLTYIIEDLKAIGVFSDNILWAKMGRYVIFILMIYNSTAVLYYFGTKEGRLSRYFSVGALFTTLLILLLTWLFAVYIENFSSYNKLYGSIGALLILMLYIWLNSNILLLGFELNASINRLKQKF